VRLFGRTPLVPEVINRPFPQGSSRRFPPRPGPAHRADAARARSRRAGRRGAAGSGSVGREASHQHSAANGSSSRSACTSARGKSLEGLVIVSNQPSTTSRVALAAAWRGTKRRQRVRSTYTPVRASCPNSRTPPQGGAVVAGDLPPREGGSEVDDPGQQAHCEQDVHGRDPARQGRLPDGLVHRAARRGPRPLARRAAAGPARPAGRTAHRRPRRGARRRQLPPALLRHRGLLRRRFARIQRRPPRPRRDHLPRPGQSNLTLPHGTVAVHGATPSRRPCARPDDRATAGRALLTRRFRLGRNLPLRRGGSSCAPAGRGSVGGSAADAERRCHRTVRVCRSRSRSRVPPPAARIWRQAA